jgi:ElaB/YqjD/DUF883 family membrane-anchored ribosome-binding protein
MDMTSEKLIRDFKVLTEDAEELIKATAGDIGDTTRKARAKLAGALVVAKETCNQFEHAAMETAHAARSYVRQHPYEVLGAAFGIGLILGILARRR